MSFSKQLLQWFDKNRREMPWRELPTPYRVWVSEIMLQQTRVATVIPYFERFMQHLPDVEALSQADEDTLLLLWQGLGYYSRVMNLRKAARIIMDEYGGEIPSTREELLLLPGIGPYTAGAVASIAFGEKAAAVDGNVLRVYTRILDCHEDIQKEKTKRLVAARATEDMPDDRPGDFNQSLMELGAMICLPQNPLCGECPVRPFCLARKNGTEALLPVKAKKKPAVIEKKTVFLLLAEETLALRQRPPEGLLKNMWEFVHTEGHLDAAQAGAFLRKRGVQVQKITPGPAYTHLFSHRSWDMISYVVTVDEEDEESRWIVAEDLKEYAIPSAFSYLLRAYWEQRQDG